MRGDYYKPELKKNVTEWWCDKKGCLKLIRSIFTYYTKGFADKVSSNLKELYSCPNFNTKTVPNDGVISG